MLLTSGANDKISFPFQDDQLINGINFLINGKGHESSKVAHSKKGCVILSSNDPIFHFSEVVLANQGALHPSLNTQSCNRRPLCSTFRFENLSISPKKTVFFTFSASKN